MCIVTLVSDPEFFDNPNYQRGAWGGLIDPQNASSTLMTKKFLTLPGLGDPLKNLFFNNQFIEFGERNF